MLLHAVTATSISAIALQPRAAPETFYLANCASNLEGPWSEIDYYKAGHVSTGEAQDNYPDDSQKVTTSNTYVWEGGDRTVTFSSSSESQSLSYSDHAWSMSNADIGVRHSLYFQYQYKCAAAAAVLDCRVCA